MTRAAATRSLHSRLQRTFTIAIVATLVAALLAFVAVRSLLAARSDLVDRVDPATLAAERLLSSVIDQETGVRALLLVGDEAFLEPYRTGLEAGAAANDDLRAAADEIGAVRPLLDDVEDAIQRWQVEYADPAIAAVEDGEPDEAPSVEDGGVLFDQIRQQVLLLQGTLDAQRVETKDQLDGATYRLVVVMALSLLTILVAIGSLWRLMQRSVQRPLDALGADAYVVAGGDLDHPVTPVGPRELQSLGSAMEQMRQRILAELSEVASTRDALEIQAVDLRRSNAELEQFAYVASHDLQEPLRKVASFCQLLQSRYRGQLDERADQYIEYAVDGSKRMQALINDLLAFSRVGRLDATTELIDGDALLARAVANLSTVIEETGAEIHADPLPVVRVEVSLAVSLLQNLLANAIKFRRDGSAPAVRITTAEHDGMHEFAVHDDGIGIEPEYAERVFVIFQRLHTKEEYEGTGIGLAVCRKIVERHGGRIWIDQGVEHGTTVRFTLPIVRADDDDDERDEDPAPEAADERESP
jgi:signal transduction histidine kinase